MIPRTIETIAWAYQQICAGEDPWTALGNFTNAWYDYAKDMRTALVNDPLVLPVHETEYTHQWAAFCAASVEFLCDRYSIPSPDWIHNPYYTLESPWWQTRQAHDPSIREHLLRETPPPFAHRNIFCNNRLYQNKYEMSQWVQEARTKGLTRPKDIWHYARQKEASIHGA